MNIRFESIKMKVKVFANLREIVKVKDHEIEVEMTRGKVSEMHNLYESVNLYII